MRCLYGRAARRGVGALRASMRVQEVCAGDWERVSALQAGSGSADRALRGLSMIAFYGSLGNENECFYGLGLVHVHKLRRADISIE